MNIRSKIFLALLSISTLVILLAGVNVFATQKAKQSFTNVDQITFPAVNILNHIKTTGFQVQQEILSLLIQSNTQIKKDSTTLQELEIACDNFKTSLGTLEAFFSTSNLGYTEQLETILKEYGNIAEQIDADIDNETTALLQARLQANELRFISVIDAALNDAIESYDTAQKASFSYLDTALRIGIGAIFAALLLSLIFGQLLSKFILKPLNSLTNAVNHFGKTVQDLPLSNRQSLQKISKQSDEIGLLAKTFLGMNQRVRSLNARLGYEASYDALTNIPNRSSFHKALTQAVQKFQQTEQTFSVLFLDFDGFKNINDSYGHRVGDELLKAIAIRLKGIVREQDVLARLGGDEFTILLNKTPLSHAQTIAEQIHQAFSTPLIAGEQNILITVSVGLAEIESELQDADTILRDADLAMYNAKNKGRGFSEIFRPTMYNSTVDRLEIEQDLHNAITNRELEVFYQPIYHATELEPSGLESSGLKPSSLESSSLKLSGFEALVRWNHPTRGRVSPVDFLQVAEETGLITDIDIFVLDTACRQILKWQKLYQQHLQLSVNFSGVHFRDKDLSSKLLTRLNQIKFNPTHLNIELTEGVLIDSTDIALESLKNLRRQGINIHLDDFGTGYSSLSYINRFPIDVLKIDKSFIQRIQSSQENLAIIRAIIAMANSLDIKVVAEGIEVEKQVNLLKNEGCNYLQGYFFAKPMATEEVTEYLIGTDSQPLTVPLSVKMPVPANKMISEVGLR